jgi:hypothetical protein
MYYLLSLSRAVISINRTDLSPGGLVIQVGQSPYCENDTQIEAVIGIKKTQIW